MHHKMTLRDTCREVHDVQKDLVDPAVLGTKNVLSAVAKSKDTVKRVVLTSSFAGERSSMYAMTYMHACSPLRM